ncbi:alpha carbonic anhydrase 4 [Manihot esculenta]|uniref:alpha carbonic anhydrase 4 n=1 Tax=Manihot esculenta TaxID=3983 RepID=UPI000B5D7A36|nr:alpha carbonic anhydrase 4 [Manihot esculenta]
MLATGNTTLFTYTEGERGPSKWGQLSPSWTACRTAAKAQSPVDLVHKAATLQPALGDLKLQYRPAAASIKSSGNFIEVIWKGNAGKIVVDGNQYKLKKIHWHTPAEHAIDGKRVDLELHLVHQNSAGGMAVIGILFKLGDADPFLTQLLPSIKTITKEGKDLGTINPGDSGIVSKSSYFRYTGSLTNPPCTEGVVWTVLDEVKMVSAEQLDALKKAVDAEFKMNSRPLQALNGRPVKFYKAAQ